MTSSETPIEEPTPEPEAVEPPFEEAGDDLFTAEESTPEEVEDDQSGTADTADDPAKRSVSVQDIVVRVGAELGRAVLPLAKAVGLAPGAVIELDRAADDPIDLYVNGKRFATGQLLLVDQTDWAIRIEQVLDLNPAEYTSGDYLI